MPTPPDRLAWLRCWPRSLVSSACGASMQEQGRGVRPVQMAGLCESILRPMSFRRRLPHSWSAFVGHRRLFSPAAKPEPVDPAHYQTDAMARIARNTGGPGSTIGVARVPGLPDGSMSRTASGGVFKSTNSGTSWTPIFDLRDRDDGRSRYRRSALDIKHRVRWVGTGEANNRRARRGATASTARRRRAHVASRGRPFAETRHIGASHCLAPDNHGK